MIEVTAGSTTSGVNQTLVADSTISGTVTNVAKAAVVGAAVTAWEGITNTKAGPIIAANGEQILASARVEIGTLIASAVTNGSGAYLLTLPPGEYTVCVAPSGASLLPAQASVATGGSHNFTLAEGGSIKGTITAAVGGAAVKGALVSAYSEGGTGVPFTDPFRQGDNAGLVVRTLTNESGQYTLTALPTGSYVLTLEAAGFEAGQR
jgi:hypothetical protein